MNASTLAILNSVVAASSPTKPRRKGVVRWNGKSVYDDVGPFAPLGMTFFWAMNGYKFERERFLANLDWLVDHGAPDYLRILAFVDWVNTPIDPAWPDYDEVLLGTLDAITSRGMRVEVTVLGSPYPNPVALCLRIARLVAQRPGTVIDVEVWNEWAQNGGDLDVMQSCARVLLAESGVPLVALSSSILVDDIRAASAACGVPLGIDHSDRGEGEGGWRMVRQGFEAKSTRLVYSNNEPPGPNSSLNVLERPLQLALFRGVTVQSGGALWVLHVGDMVMGVEDPAHGRHANLWQIDNLAGIFAAVHAVEPWLPVGVENWNKTAGNPNIRPQAMVPDVAGWPDGGEGCNRFYAALDGSRFCQTLLGIKGRRTFTQVMPDGGTYHVTGINPETGEAFDRTLRSGESFVIDGPADGMLGYILNGVRVEHGTFAEQVVYPSMVVADDLLAEV